MLWLGGPVWQWIWDISAPRKHRKSNFVFINCVFCNVDGGKCEQLFRWDAFVNEFLGAWKSAHGSDDESGDDSISAAVWEAISAQSNSFIMEKCEFWCRNAKHSQRNSRPMSWTVRCAAVIFSTKNSRNKSTGKRSSKPGVPRSTMFGQVPVDEVRSANIWKWNQRRWHETLRSVCYAAVMISDSTHDDMKSVTLSHIICRNYMWCFIHWHVLCCVRADHLGDHATRCGFSKMVLQLQLFHLYCGSVSEFFNEEFPERWIVRGTATPPSPMSWSPRIADLTTPDYSLSE